MFDDESSSIVRYCPITANKVACVACSLYDGKCLVRAALRSLPRIAEELKKLGWIECLSETLEQFTDPCRLDIEPLDDADDEDEET